MSADGRLLATPVAVIAGLVYNFLPFMVLPLFASIDKIDHRLIEAAGDLYSRPIVGFFKVTWPLSLPGVVSGTLLTFIPAVGDYINAELLGSPGQRMIGNVIQSLFTDANDYPAAGALSVMLMLLILGWCSSTSAAQGRRSCCELPAATPRPVDQQAPRPDRWPAGPRLHVHPDRRRHPDELQQAQEQADLQVRLVHAGQLAEPLQGRRACAPR